MAQGDAQSKHGIPPVEISLVIAQFGKPPLVELQGEVILRNDRSEPHWFLIPMALPDPSRGEGGVDHMEVSAIEGTQRGVLAGLFGTGGVWALLLPPGGRARITRLPIQYWGELPTSVDIRVRTAREVVLRGESLQQWFGLDAMNPAQVEGEFPVGGKGRLATLKLPENREAPLVLTDEQVVSATAPVHDNRGKN